MVNNLPVPADASTDAVNRAWRTLVQGLALDVVVAIVAVLATNVGDAQWTKEYWLGIAALLGKSVVTAIVSYFARKYLPPSTT
ncbi:hypothetical protein ACQP1P_38480 [Dactylosporangium sp. CA-052675]|uniref:hypothetical protein n=1 Tax=Dactylosporangium sp. CA-052675 TaxID=3239927 RepID=UPI003D8AD86A